MTIDELMNLWNKAGDAFLVEFCQCKACKNDPTDNEIYRCMVHENQVRWRLKWMLPYLDPASHELKEKISQIIFRK